MRDHDETDDCYDPISQDELELSGTVTVDGDDPRDPEPSRTEDTRPAAARYDATSAALLVDTDARNVQNVKRELKAKRFIKIQDADNVFIDLEDAR